MEKLEDNRKTLVKEKCKILVCVGNGDHLSISDVFYVPGLDCNFLVLANFKRNDMFCILRMVYVS